MEKLPTYQQQFDKITEAYIKGEIKPYEPCFCFCGTLCNNESSWFLSSRGEGNGAGGYSHKELKRMESALVYTIDKQTVNHGCKFHLPETVEPHPNYENALFNGMVAALEVLKQIHIERGEVIDEVPAFKKREPTTTPLTLKPSIN